MDSKASFEYDSFLATNLNRDRSESLPKLKDPRSPRSLSASLKKQSFEINSFTPNEKTFNIRNKKYREKTMQVNCENLIRMSSQMKLRYIKTYPNNIQIPNEKTEDIKIWIHKTLSTHFLFREWDPFLLEQIISLFYQVKLNENEILLSSKEQLSSFYLIEKGIISMNNIETGEIDILDSGKLLGVRSIFGESIVNFEIKAKTNETILWGLQISKFQEVIKNLVSKAFQERRILLERVAYFDDLPNSMKSELTCYMQRKTVIGPVILSKNENFFENLYIIIKGEVILVYSDKSEKLLKEFQVFGQEKLNEIEINKVNYEVKVEKGKELEYLMINKKTLKIILGENYTKLLYDRLLREILKKSKIFILIDGIAREKVIRALKIKEKKNSEIIYRKEDEFFKLIIILNGEAISSNEKIILKKEDIYNEDCFFIENAQNSNTYEIFMRESGTIAEITTEKLYKILKTNDLKEFFSLKKKKFKISFTELNSPYSPFIHMESVNSNLKKTIIEIKKKKKYEHVHILKELGEGQFGLVLLVKIEDRYFALKVISKAWVIENNLQDYLINEKKICRMLDNLFIIHMDFTFKDEYHIYLLFEYISGMDLSTYIYKNNGEIKIKTSKFYTANLILAIEYLHSKRVLHRDLKPENIMITKTGYLKVIDLGAAKLILEPESDSSPDSPSFFCEPKKAYTIIGTPEYMAPEIIKGMGYSFAVDLWSLGIIIYELLCGFTPFETDIEDPIEKYKNILEEKLVFPSELTDNKAKKLIKQLLSKTPEERLGGSFDALKAQKWFDDIDWKEFAELKCVPPFIPKIEDLEKYVQKNVNLKAVIESGTLGDLKTKIVDDWDEIF